MSKQLDGIVDRLEENFAIIILKDGQKLNWPLDQLDFNIKEGQAVTISINFNELETQKKEQLAKDVLNEILGQS